MLRKIAGDGLRFMVFEAASRPERDGDGGRETVMATIEREEWELDAFEGLEEMSAAHTDVARGPMNELPREPSPRKATQNELAAGMRQMPVWDDDVWCPRLA